MHDLRPYQSKAIESLRTALINGRRPVLSSPTGSGKTRIASEIFALARAKNRRVAFCVPFLSLINQTYKAFIEAGVDEREIGIIQGNHELTDWSREVQICSIDTLARRPKFPDADIVIFDEVHKRSVVHERWMVHNPDAWFIGLSATPWSVGMDNLWNEMIIVSTVKDLIDQKYLAPFKYYAPTQPDLSGVKITAGDYQVDQLAERMSGVELTADIVQQWLKRGEWRPTFCFAVNRRHAAEIQHQFEMANVPCGYIDALTPVDEREALIEQLRRGDIKVICNIGCLTTGLDAPFVSCLILARPTKSEMLYIQIVGRGLRTALGKDNCIILDHSSTGLDLGRPDEIFYDDFVTGPIAKTAKQERQKKEKKPRLCPACQAVVTPKAKVCECGFEFKPAPSDIYVADGDLSELGSKGKIAKATYDEKQMWYSGLLWIASERGYSKGWSAHTYKKRFGVWPRGLNEKPDYPSQTVLNFVRSKNIAFAKNRDKSNAQV